MKPTSVIIRETLRNIYIGTRFLVLTRWYKMDIAPSARISARARLDKSAPMRIHVGGGSYIASGAVIMAHDYCRGVSEDTRIGERCFIGVNAIVMSGVTIGDEVIVGSGAVVTNNVPSNCIVAGVPARILRQGIHTRKYGQLIDEEHAGDNR